MIRRITAPIGESRLPRICLDDLTSAGSGVFDGTGNFNTGTIICALRGTISMNRH